MLIEVVDIVFQVFFLYLIGQVFFKNDLQDDKVILSWAPKCANVKIQFLLILKYTWNNSSGGLICLLNLEFRSYRVLIFCWVDSWQTHKQEKICITFYFLN